MEIIDCVEDYVSHMKEIFDFTKIKALIQGSEQRAPFKVLIDSMHGGELFFISSIDFQIGDLQFFVLVTRLLPYLCDFDGSLFLQKGCTSLT